MANKGQRRVKHSHYMKFWLLIAGWLVPHNSLVPSDYVLSLKHMYSVNTNNKFNK